MSEINSRKLRLQMLSRNNSKKITKKIRLTSEAYHLIRISEAIVRVDDLKKR